MKTTGSKYNARRRPKQLRARQTVEAVLDAVIRLLKREESSTITTNRIAEVAGVSIGSVYQYFPDKRAIFAALHERHIEQIDRMVQTKLVQYARAPMDEFVRAMVEGMVEAHSGDPELYQMLMKEVPHRAGGAREFSVRLHGAFLLAISSRRRKLKRGRSLDRTAFVLTHMIDALTHGAVLHRPPGMSLRDAKEEAARAILAYLQA